MTKTENGTSLTYHYGIKGEITKVDHNGFLYNYEYDSFGNTTKVKVGNQSLVSYTYLPDKSKLASMTYGNGDKVTYTYDNYGGIKQKTLSGLGSYTYLTDANGRTVYEKDSISGERTTYQYDSKGNLAGERVYDNQSYTYRNQLYSIANNYDDDGNITKNALKTHVGTLTTTYTYGAETGLPSTVTMYGGNQISYSYDDEGTLTGRSLSTSTPVAESFVYNADGLRTSKTVNGVKHNYYYVDGQLRYERNGDSYEIYYTYDADGRPVLATKRDLVAKKNYQYYLITNTRGDVIETRNGDGNVNAKFVYDAWGKLVSVTDANGNALAQDSFAYQISLKYRGYVYDNETGLYYLQSRYYDPETGRFLNADDVDYIGLSDTPIGWNGFAYCENEPVNDSDPSGYKSYSGIIGFGIQILLYANVLCYQGFIGVEALWFTATKNNNFGNGIVPWCYWFLGGNVGFTLDFKKILSKNFLNNPRNVLKGFGFSFSVSVSITFFLIKANKMKSPEDYTRYFTLNSITAWGVTASKATGGTISTYGIVYTRTIGVKGRSIGELLFGGTRGLSYYWALPINNNAKALYSIVKSKV